MTIEFTVIEKDLMQLIEKIAGSRVTSKMICDSHFAKAAQSVSEYVETQAGKDALEMHLKYVQAMNQAIAFVSELIKKIHAPVVAPTSEAEAPAAIEAAPDAPVAQ